MLLGYLLVIANKKHGKKRGKTVVLSNVISSSTVENVKLGIFSCASNLNSSGAVALPRPLVHVKGTTRSKTKIATGTKMYLFFTFLQLALIGGLRGVSVGTDTWNYENYFNMTLDASFSYLLGMRMENGFVFLYALIGRLGGNYSVALFVTNGIVVGGFIILIKNHSVNVVFSVFLLITLGYFQASFNGVRHFMATVFLLNSLGYINSKKPIKFAIMILLASLFHRVAIIFLLLYFIRFIRWEKTTFIIFFVVVAISFIFFDLFVNIGVLIWPAFSFYLDTVFFQPNTGWLKAVTYTLMLGMLLMIVCFMPRRGKLITSSGKKYLLGRKNNIYFTIAMIVLACLILSYRVMMMIDRVALFFSPLFIVLIPNFLRLIKNRGDRNILTSVFVVVCILHYIIIMQTGWHNSVPWVPFWANVPA